MMDTVMMLEMAGIIIGAVSVLNGALFKFYNGKLNDVKEKLDALDEKLDNIVKEYGERISKLESDVRWLKNKG